MLWFSLKIYQHTHFITIMMNSTFVVNVNLQISWLGFRVVFTNIQHCRCLLTEGLKPSPPVEEESLPAKSPWRSVQNICSLCLYVELYQNHSMNLWLSSEHTWVSAHIIAATRVTSAAHRWSIDRLIQPEDSSDQSCVTDLQSIFDVCRVSWQGN